MSPAVGNFVQDLVEMAKATETLPIVQHENETLKADLSRAQDTIAARETAIISYKQQIEDLHAKVRSLEVERDDASFRVLEAEDTAHSILTQARNAQATLAEVISKLDPPKPELVKEPEPEVLPQTATMEQALTGQGWHPKQVDDPNLPISPPDAPQDQSEAPPTQAPITPSGLGETPSPASPSPSELFPYSSEPSDPEPHPRYSYEWYQWNDRRNERNKRQNEQADKAASGY